MSSTVRNAPSKLARFLLPQLLNVGRRLIGFSLRDLMLTVFGLLLRGCLFLERDAFAFRDHDRRGEDPLR
jgi:hypothetical protein